MSSSYCYYYKMEHEYCLYNNMHLDKFSHCLCNVRITSYIFCLHLSPYCCLGACLLFQFQVPYL
uniref:Uncharacterized protein n=1 Tax=Arundo donax TaxID=35708 RepID=A0A0A9CKF8_ARUDO